MQPNIKVVEFTSPKGNARVELVTYRNNRAYFVVLNGKRVATCISYAVARTMWEELCADL